MSSQPIVIGLSFRETPPLSIEAGTAFACAVSLDWPNEIVPKDARYILRNGADVLQHGPLPGPNSERSVALALRAPHEIGEHHLTIVVTGEERGGGNTVEGALPFCLTTVPHDTSLAVWDVPSPIVRGAAFEITVGAKCSVSCALAGAVIEIRDESDRLMGSGVLGDGALSETSALHATTIALKAPATCALHFWVASFAPCALPLPHHHATSRFSFVTVGEPEHAVSLKVVNRETRAPIEGAYVSLGVHRAVTDRMGTAKLFVPKGAFPVVVTSAGYKAPERTIKVAKDVRLQIAAEKLPEADPFALWSD
jgi:hypothetical protein